MYVPVISLRYLRRKKWGLQSIIGITIGVATLIVVVSIMRGFDSELKSRIRGTLSHITIHKGGAFFPNNYVELIKEIESLPHVEACAPYIETPAFVKIRKNKRFVVLKGIKPHNESLVGNLQEYTSNCGSTINDLSKLHGAKNNYSVLCGIELLRIGSGEPETFPNNFINKGEKLVVFCIKDWGKMSVLPFIINGMFKTNMQEYDDNYIYVPLEAAQKLVGKAHAINGISVKLDNYDYANKLKKIIQNILGYEYFVNTWEDTRRSLLRTLVLERKIMGIILFLIIIMAGFSINSLLSRIIREKSRDIGILKSLGASNLSLFFIFLSIGIFIGSVGSILGLAVSILFLHYINLILSYFGKLPILEFLSPENLYFESLPVSFNLESIIIIIISTILCSIVFSLLPAVAASRMNPVDLLRHE